VVSHRESTWIAIIAVILICLWSRTGWPQYAPTSGPYNVLTVEKLLLHDSTRGKDIPIKIYYPAGVGRFPVIIFSHGALASKDAYSGLGQYWASYGYVSIHPSHADSIADSGFRGTLRQALSDPSAWENRPEDVSFIIDSLAHVETLVPQLAGKLDLHHIGVGGHSFGAYTAGLIGGELPARLHNFRRPSIVALPVGNLRLYPPNMGAQRVVPTEICAKPSGSSVGSGSVWIVKVAVHVSEQRA